MNARHLAVIVIALASAAAGAASLPCASFERELRALAPGGAEVPAGLIACVHTSRVCVLSFPEGKILRAEAVRELPVEGSSILGVVQSPAGEQPAVCLVGTYSGGSAAGWVFDGWTIVEGKVVPIRGMERSQLNSDAVPPRTLGNAIYGAYARSKK